jgi:hypothetical protein
MQMLGLLAIAAFIAAGFGYLSILWHLKYHQPELWQGLGCPTFWIANISRAHRNLMRFLVRGEFRSIGDSTLTTYCVLYLGGLLMFLGIFLLALIRRSVAL